MTGTEQGSALERLRGALVEQDRLTARYDAAIGTPAELGAYARLSAAGEYVAARQAWVHWIEDEHYRGLNAGPFSLLAEGSGEGPTATRQLVSAGPAGGR
jgi:hypothetical protein